MCCVNMLVLSICYALVKGGLPGPDNVQVSLEFVNNVPLITVTWDPPLIIDPANIKINSYEVAIFNLNNTVDSQQVQDTYVVDNQTTSWSISNVTLSGKYYVSVRVDYTTEYSKAINSSSIDIRFLQNFTTNINGSLLRARCHLAKSDLFVDCQLVILNVEKNSEVLSPVNIMQSDFSMLLPSSKNEFLVTARAVDIHGDTVDLEMSNISHIITPMITPTPDAHAMNASRSLSDTESNCSMLTPLAIWLIIIFLLIILLILISLIIITLHKSGVCRPKKSELIRKHEPIRKSTVNLASTSVPPANDSKVTYSPPIPNLILKSKEDPPLKSREDPPLKSLEDPLLRSQKDLNIGPYENISMHPKPSNVRHSHIQIHECPAYRTLGGDYDDICSTAVIMQPNPSYKHDMFCQNT